MKQVAAIILTRNLPELADELGQWLLERHGDQVDLYVVENGSDSDKLSRFANVVFKESYGPAGGINKALEHAMRLGHEYFWVNYNDVRYAQNGFLDRALEVIKQDERIGLFFPWWEGNMRPSGKLGQNLEILTYSDILSFVVTRSALDVLKNFNDLPGVSLEPFWDSSNYTAHHNLLATTLALYRSGLAMVADRRYTVWEKAAVADRQSKQARGFAAKTWKHELGPQSIETWLKKAFPNIYGEPKEVRDRVLLRIDRLIAQSFPEAVSRRERISRGLRDMVTAGHV